jgi:signal recognition particle receptor subunit beta
VYARLRPDHRGEMRQVPTRLDPTVTFQMLPIELGEIAGIRTRIQLLEMPDAPDQAATRKQLLDEVDGIVLVIDSQGHRIEENVESFNELRQALADYGRSPRDVPMVVQYNKRDLADPYAAEDLYRKLELTGIPVFQAVATEGTGVLETLSTISKRVVGSLRGQADSAPRPTPSPPPPPPAPAASSTPPPAVASPVELMEEAILEEAGQTNPLSIESDPEPIEAPILEPMAILEPSTGVQLGSQMSIVSVGEATRAGDRAVRVPVVVGDAEGHTSTLLLTIQLEPLLDESS